MRESVKKSNDVDEKMLELTEDDSPEILDCSLCKIDFSDIQKERLQRAGISTLLELSGKTKAEIESIKGFTGKDVAEIEFKLKFFYSYGCELRDSGFDNMIKEYAPELFEKRKGNLK